MLYLAGRFPPLGIGKEGGERARKAGPAKLTAEVRLRATEAGKDQEMSAGICVYGGEEGVRFGCQSLSVCVRVISDQPSSPRLVRVRHSLPPLRAWSRAAHDGSELEGGDVDSRAEPFGTTQSDGAVPPPLALLGLARLVRSS